MFDIYNWAHAIGRIVEERRERKRRKHMQAANRRNIYNLALGHDKMNRKPMMWGRL